MNSVLKKKYGKNNYSLEDRIPKSARPLRTYTHSLHSDRYKIERIEDCILIACGGFNTISDYLFHHNGENFSSITDKTKTLTRSRNRLAINDGVSTMIYELDGKGYPIRIEDKDGTFMNVTYKKDHGDFQNLTSLFDRAMGNPIMNLVLEVNASLKRIFNIGNCYLII